MPFTEHVELLQQFLRQRRGIVRRIDDVLNAQRQPVEFLRDRALLARLLDQCFFSDPAIDDLKRRLQGQLEAAHRDSGFLPRQMSELFNDLISPAELLVRGFYCWQQTRWPGRNARERYAQTLFNLYVVRSLVLLSMRIWDDPAESASARLARVQQLLDSLWQTAPADQPVLVRDARWLISLAQAPTTDELGAYFDVAGKVAEGLRVADRLEVARAHVRILGGHLTSQTRHYCINEQLTPDSRSLVLRTRRSNALDFALLVQGLVPLLEAYETACERSDDSARHDLAGAILQGISPDPEVFLERLDLLGPYSMIEELFVGADGDGEANCTAQGARHVRLLDTCRTLIRRQITALHEDCPRFRPVAGGYSPYGAIFGTPTNLLENIALKTLDRAAVAGLGLEDVFTDGDAARLAWVDGWRQLPHIPREAQALWAYPQPFAEEIHARIAAVLARCVGGASPQPATGRLLIEAGDSLELPAGFAVSSDQALVAAGHAQWCDEGKLLRDRKEGYFLVSFRTAGGWLALSKDLVTEVLAAGQDARVAGLPATAAGLLRLMCPGIGTR